VVVEQHQESGKTEPADLVTITISRVVARWLDLHLQQQFKMHGFRPHDPVPPEVAVVGQAVQEAMEPTPAFAGFSHGSDVNVSWEEAIVLAGMCRRAHKQAGIELEAMRSTDPDRRLLPESLRDAPLEELRDQVNPWCSRCMLLEHLVKVFTDAVPDSYTDRFKSAGDHLTITPQPTLLDPIMRRMIAAEDSRILASIAAPAAGSEDVARRERQKLHREPDNLIYFQ